MVELDASKPKGSNAKRGWIIIFVGIMVGAVAIYFPQYAYSISPILGYSLDGIWIILLIYGGASLIGQRSKSDTVHGDFDCFSDDELIQMLKSKNASDDDAMMIEKILHSRRVSLPKTATKSS